MRITICDQSQVLYLVVFNRVGPVQRTQSLHTQIMKQRDAKWICQWDFILRCMALVLNSFSYA